MTKRPILRRDGEAVQVFHAMVGLLDTLLMLCGHIGQYVSPTFNPKIAAYNTNQTPGFERPTPAERWANPVTGTTAVIVSMMLSSGTDLNRIDNGQSTDNK